jgi:hypothetical protein
MTYKNTMQAYVQMCLLDFEPCCLWEVFGALRTNRLTINHIRNLRLRKYSKFVGILNN